MLRFETRSLIFVLGLGLAVCTPASAQVQSGATVRAAGTPVATVPGMPPVPDPTNSYSEQTAGKLSAAVAGDLPRVYVPHVKSNDVYVIDPSTFKVVDRFKVGSNPQHVVPSWDLKTLWVAGKPRAAPTGSLTPIDPKTGEPGPAVMVDDPYNMYFTPDGSAAIVVAEAFKRLDFRDPQTMKLQSFADVPQCSGVNRADFSIDGRYAIFTCEFTGGGSRKSIWPRAKSTVISDLAKRKMPQDIRLSPDGTVFYVADMEADGLFLVDATRSRRSASSPPASALTASIRAATGASSTSPIAARRSAASRVGWAAFPSSTSRHARSKRTGRCPVAAVPTWGTSARTARHLWLSARFDNAVYAVDTASGTVQSIPVGKGAGLTVWPQPGRYSLGHTGNMR